MIHLMLFIYIRKHNKLSFVGVAGAKWKTDRDKGKINFDSWLQMAGDDFPI